MRSQSMKAIHARNYGRKATGSWKRPSPAQEFTRKRNWAKFQIYGMKGHAVSLSYRYPLAEVEKLDLERIQTKLDDMLYFWEKRTELLKEIKNERKT